MSTEWEQLSPSQPVRQGDLLVSRNRSDGKITDMLIVITADCDISNEKFGSNLACLKIISLKEYHESIWAERRLNSTVKKFEKGLLCRIRKWHSLQVGIESTLTLDAIFDWLREDTPEALCKLFDVPPQKIESLAVALNGLVRGRQLCSDKTSIPIKQLINYRHETEGLSTEAIWNTILKAIDTNLSNDVFSLPKLPEELDSTPSVVVLRNLISLDPKSVYLGVTGASEKSYLRVARLNPVFKHGLSQAFGALYSRIGFPDEHDKLHKEAVNNIRENWEYNYE